MGSNLVQQRNIRVFISSTFRDMQDERDELMKRVFPKLRHIASMRDVTISEVDLRWGITEDEANCGQVVGICLKEIENSIPFFIGIIGNRYGWIPTPEDLGVGIVNQYPDVNTYIQNRISVTEMEMQFGVLKREEDMHAYFYIKDVQGEEDDCELLGELKNAVLESKYPSNTYTSSDDLAFQVERDFIDLLDKLYPPRPLSEEDREDLEHHLKINDLHQCYVSNKANEEKLNEWIKDTDRQMLLVKGPDGVGKSTLICNWLYNNELLADYYVVERHVGTNFSDIDWIRAKLAKEISVQCSMSYDGESLEDVIGRVADDKKLLIVLDGIDEITSTRKDESDGICRLLIETTIPSHIRMLFAMSSQCYGLNIDLVCYDTLSHLKLANLTSDERADFIREYLSFFSKKLSDKQLKTLSENELTENPMALRMVLDELLTYGEFDTLDKKISTFLPPKKRSHSQMYQIYEINDSPKDRPVYICCAIINALKNVFGSSVEKVVCLIGMTKYGIKEDDIMQVAQINKLQWSYLYCNLLPQLTTSLGYIRFKNFSFYRAVRDLYLRNMNHISLRGKLIELLEKRHEPSDLRELTYLCIDQCAELDYIQGSEKEQIRLSRLAAKIDEDKADIWCAAHDYQQLARYLEANDQTSDAIEALKKAKELYSMESKYAEYVEYIDKELEKM